MSKRINALFCLNGFFICLLLNVVIMVNVSYSNSLIKLFLDTKKKKIIIVANSTQMMPIFVNVLKAFFCVYFVYEQLFFFI